MEPKLMEIAIKQGKRQESKTSSRSPGGFVSFSSIWIMDTPALFLKNTKSEHSNFVFKLTSIIISFNIIMAICLTVILFSTALNIGQ